MSITYTKPLAMDRNGNPMQDPPSPAIALQTLVSENATVSSVISLNPGTTLMEVAAVGQAVAIKWIAQGNTNPSVISAAGTANYDHIVPSGTVRKFVVPIETIGVPSIVGLNRQAGLYQRVAWKSSGIGSVLSAEY